jgi:EAL domain-containing protein (putative c-di-GMP-specific phosphodiesterase class I)
VLEVGAKDEDAAIVCSTIDAGHNVGVKAVAESVETFASWRMLFDLGCDLAQGT